METFTKTPPLCHLVTVTPAPAPAIISEFPLNPWESFRAELMQRRGKSVVSIGRWKTTPAGLKHTGQLIEFGAHRTVGTAKLIADVQAALATLDVDGGAA